MLAVWTYTMLIQICIEKQLNHCISLTKGLKINKSKSAIYFRKRKLSRAVTLTLFGEGQHLFEFHTFQLKSEWASQSQNQLSPKLIRSRDDSLFHPSLAHESHEEIFEAVLILNYSMHN